MTAQHFRLNAKQGRATPRSGPCNIFPSAVGLASQRPGSLLISLLLLPLLLIAACVTEGLARLRP
jgi:hypothetical protein